MLKTLTLAAALAAASFAAAAAPVTYKIDPKKCTECDGHFDTPQCAAVCPVPNTCVPA